MVNGLSSKKQKTLHPLQGRRVLSAVPPELYVKMTFDIPLFRDNGLTRHQLLGFTGEVSLASGRRVRSFYPF